MSARRPLRATQRFLDRLMPWLFAVWLLGHAAADYRRAGALTALVFLGASWALYDYGKERGQRQMADDLLRVFRHKARRR